MAAVHFWDAMSSEWTISELQGDTKPQFQSRIHLNCGDMREHAFLLPLIHSSLWIAAVLSSEPAVNVCYLWLKEAMLLLSFGFGEENASQKISCSVLLFLLVLNSFIQTFLQGMNRGKNIHWCVEENVHNAPEVTSSQYLLKNIDVNTRVMGCWNKWGIIQLDKRVIYLWIVFAAGSNKEGRLMPYFCDFLKA